MKRTIVFAIAGSIIAATAVVGLSTPPAFAQQDKGMGHGMMGSDKAGGMMGEGGMMGGGGMMGMMGHGCPMMGMMMGGDMPMYRKGRIAFLKAELAITEAQTTVWEAYADALKKNMQGMQDMHKTMMAAGTGKTPVERLDARITAMEGRLQALKEIKPKLAALYDVLSGDQKKKADQLLTGIGCMI